MRDKRYPTKMHEVLTKPGELPLQTGEIFTINEDDYGFYHMLDCEGQIIFADQEDAKEYRKERKPIDWKYCPKCGRDLLTK